jgi:hypothetical protein
MSRSVIRLDFRLTTAIFIFTRERSLTTSRTVYRSSLNLLPFASWTAQRPLGWCRVMKHRLNVYPCKSKDAPTRYLEQRHKGGWGNSRGDRRNFNLDPSWKLSASRSDRFISRKNDCAAVCVVGCLGLATADCAIFFYLLSCFAFCVTHIFIFTIPPFPPPLHHHGREEQHFMFVIMTVFGKFWRAITNFVLIYSKLF